MRVPRLRRPDEGDFDPVADVPQPGAVATRRCRFPVPAIGRQNARESVPTGEIGSLDRTDERAEGMNAAARIRCHHEPSLVIHRQHVQGVHVIGLAQLVGNLQAKHAIRGYGKVEIVEVRALERPHDRAAEGARVQAPVLSVPGVDEGTRYVRFLRRRWWIFLQRAGDDGGRDAECEDEAHGAGRADLLNLDGANIG